MEFNKNNILTSVTADQANKGDLGWFGDSIAGIRNRVERGKDPKELTEVLPDDNTHRFNAKANAYNLFYPAPYEYLQEQWVKENKLGVGDKVAIISNWESGDKGYKYNQSRPAGSVLFVAKIDCEAITAILDTTLDAAPVDLPYFAIEKVKEEYRPFANTEEFALYRDMWFRSKGGGDSFTRKVEEYCYDGVKIGGQHLKYICFLDKYVFADTGEPAGVKL